MSWSLPSPPAAHAVARVATPSGAPTPHECDGLVRGESSRQEPCGKRHSIKDGPSELSRCLLHAVESQPDAAALRFAIERFQVFAVRRELFERWLDELE